MHAKGPAPLHEQKIGPFLIRERQARFREAGEGYEVRFVFGLDTNVRLRLFGTKEECNGFINAVFSATGLWRAANPVSLGE